jgi:tripartite-type tricarboxylate transporter receptor subunit TctC
LSPNRVHFGGKCSSVRYLALAAALVVAGLVVLHGPESASAEEWPTRNVTVVVPLGAGSASDVMARIVMDQVARQVGQTFVIENRPGAGGTIGANMVAKSAPDGYTILAYGALGSAHALYAHLPYDTLNDFVPVIPLGQQPLAVVTSPATGYRTLGDLVAAAKAKSNNMNYSSAGIGSASHLAAERLRVSAKFTAQHIAFRGAAEALTEVIAGRMDFSVQPFTTTLALVRDGKLIALAVSAANRTAAMPDVPTTIEAGLAADSVYTFYSGLFVPARTSRDIVDKLQRETAKALQTPAVRARLVALGVEPMVMTLDEFGKFHRDDVEANLALVKAAGIPAQ